MQFKIKLCTMTMHTLFEISLILCMLKLSASQGFCNSAQGKIISGTPMKSLFSNNKRGYNCMIRNNTVKNNSLHSRLFPVSSGSRRGNGPDI